VRLGAAHILRVMPPGDRRVIAVELDSDDASHVAQVLLQIGALIDPDDPDGLRDAFGVLQPELTALKLSEDQFRMLDPLTSYNDDDRASVAGRLRQIAATIEGQLPPDAPEVIHRQPIPRQPN
jgi:hypothetical protein